MVGNMQFSAILSITQVKMTTAFLFYERKTYRYIKVLYVCV